MTTCRPASVLLLIHAADCPCSYVNCSCSCVSCRSTCVYSLCSAPCSWTVFWPFRIISLDSEVTVKKRFLSCKLPPPHPPTVICLVQKDKYNRDFLNPSLCSVRSRPRTKTGRTLHSSIHPLIYPFLTGSRRRVSVSSWSLEADIRRSRVCITLRRSPHSHLQ